MRYFWGQKSRGKFVDDEEVFEHEEFHEVELAKCRNFMRLLLRGRWWTFWTSSLVVEILLGFSKLRNQFWGGHFSIFRPATVAHLWPHDVTCYDMLSLLPDDEQKSSWGFSQPLVQGGAPYLAKLMYNNVHYGFWWKKNFGFTKQLITRGVQPTFTVVAGGVFFSWSHRDISPLWDHRAVVTRWNSDPPKLHLDSCLLVARPGQRWVVSLNNPFVTKGFFTTIGRKWSLVDWGARKTYIQWLVPCESEQ